MDCHIWKLSQSSGSCIGYFQPTAHFCQIIAACRLSQNLLIHCLPAFGIDVAQQKAQPFGYMYLHQHGVSRA